MKRILIFAAFIFMLAIAGYFVWSLKDKDLKFVPKNADVLVLIDVKKASEEYILSLIKHPSKWSENSKGSAENNGVEVPDYIQIFHLKNTGFSDWYTILEISDRDNFVKFLKENGFKIIKKDLYTKDQFSVKIEGSQFIVGFSNKNFENTALSLLNSDANKKINADQLINNSIGSVSYLSDSQSQTFSIDLNDDNIEIKNNSEKGISGSILSDLEKQTSFLKLELDSRNIQKASKLFNKKLSDSLNINSISAVAELEVVNDKIISYSYDDNFNEVEKVSYQKIVQPNYTISLQSFKAEKTWSYFQQKNWINAQNQFTIIPFQPNIIRKNGNEFSIKSTRKEIAFRQKFSENYAFIKNNSLLINSIKSLSASEKKAISNIDYLFYRNKEDYYYLKLKFKKDKLPLILRW